MAWSMGSIIPYVVSEASHWLIVLRIAQWPSDKGIPFLDNRLLFFHLYICCCYAVQRIHHTEESALGESGGWRYITSQ
jgi:hypothetical protein